MREDDDLRHESEALDLPAGERALDGSVHAPAGERFRGAIDAFDGRLDGAMIGANCVVTKDLPADSIMIAAPSRIIPRTLSTQARRWDKPEETLEQLNNDPHNVDI